jgi:hypothetical protein
MLSSLFLKTLPERNDALADHAPILLAARAPTSLARSKNSRRYPSPPYLTAPKAVWLHNKIFHSTARPCRPKKSRNHFGLRRSLIRCMNVLFSGGATTIRDWCHRNLQSAVYRADASRAASGKGNWSLFFSGARSLTSPALTIQRPTIRRTVDTGTVAAMGATKAKPSIVWIIRVRRRAGESRFLERERNLSA